MNILILSCSTGEGHNSAAASIYEELKQRKQKVVLRDALSFGNVKAQKIVSSFFNNIAVKSPSLFGIMYKAGSIVSNNYIKSPVYLANLIYSNNLLKFIIQNKIDKVICTHLFPMEALTYLKRRKMLNIECMGILTDYTAIPFIEETELDKYFIPNKDLIKEFVKKGLSRDKLIPTGIPVLNKFTANYDKKDARKILNLPLDHKIVLIMTGGVGCGDIINILNCLTNSLDDNTIILVLTGRNKSLKNKIDICFDNTKVKSVSFTKRVEIFMNACDILLSKPGGLSSTEAAVVGVPLIHTMPIPGCETLNSNFFNKRGMSIKVNNMTELLEKTLSLLNSVQIQEKMIKNQNKYINKCASKDIVDGILKV